MIGLNNPSGYPCIARLLAVALMSGSTSCTILNYQIGNQTVQGYTSSKVSKNLNPVAEFPQSRSDILDRFGPPDKVGTLKSGHYVFAYECRIVKERQVGINIPTFKLLKYSVGKALADRFILLIELNQDDQLHAVGASHWVEDVGYGTNIQFFIAIAPTTDTSALRERSDTESWTTRLLSGPIGLVDLSHDSDLTSQGLRFSGMPQPNIQWTTNKWQR